MLTLDDFDFSLPPELIAQHPAPERTASRLLHVAGATLHDRNFTDLPPLIAPGDLLVFNDTRVIKARLFGQKDSGGQIEVMIERIIDRHHAVAQIRASKSPKPGSRIVLENAFALTVTGRDQWRQIGEAPVVERLAHDVQQAAGSALRSRVLGNQFGRKGEVKIVECEHAREKCVQRGLVGCG